MKSALVNKYFHTLRDDGTIERQGIVLDPVGDGYYLVEWFSWFDGSPNGMSVKSIYEMSQWQFYRTGDEMREEYYKRNEKELVR